ncbi:invasion associated locus B family protein [Pelagibius sp.]|uniref:invasion associated locus B family protein n=1 Tax=Pelagibius sp. TaxID=1931238 RepID=UPI002630B3B4|nr:invasion associated locus B family protein [Pelagibius sp.]
MLTALHPVRTQAQNQPQVQPQIQPQPGINQQPPRLAPTGETFGDWQVICAVADAANSPAQPQQCFISQQFLDPSSQQPVLKVTVGFFRGDNLAGAVIAMPLGIPLARGVQISVDGRAIRTVPFEFCRRNGCQAFVRLNEEVLNAFRAGNQAAAIVPLGRGEALNMPFSLRGFTKGYARIQ